MTQESWKMTKTLHRYSSDSTQPKLSNEYQYVWFRWFSKIFASLCFGNFLRNDGTYQAVPGSHFCVDIAELWRKTPRLDALELDSELKKMNTKG